MPRFYIPELRYDPMETRVRTDPETAQAAGRGFALGAEISQATAARKAAAQREERLADQEARQQAQFEAKMAMDLRKLELEEAESRAKLAQKALSDRQAAEIYTAATKAREMESPLQTMQRRASRYMEKLQAEGADAKTMEMAFETFSKVISERQKQEAGEAAQETIKDAMLDQSLSDEETQQFQQRMAMGENPVQVFKDVSKLTNERNEEKAKAEAADEEWAEADERYKKLMEVTLDGDLKRQMREKWARTKRDSYRLKNNADADLEAIAILHSQEDPSLRAQAIRSRVLQAQKDIPLEPLRGPLGFQILEASGFPGSAEQAEFGPEMKAHLDKKAKEREARGGVGSTLRGKKKYRSEEAELSAGI